jgi:hypothetical protein
MLLRESQYIPIFSQFHICKLFALLKFLFFHRKFSSKCILQIKENITALSSCLETGLRTLNMCIYLVLTTDPEMHNLEIKQLLGI